MDLLRTFISIDLEDEEIIKKILSYQKELSNLAKIKFVEGFNLHFTLKFLGEIEENIVEEVKTQLGKIVFNSFNVSLRGLGCFKPSYPRVIWVGVERGAEEIIELMNKINSVLMKIGFKKDAKKLIPHLTIGRVKYVTNRKELISKLESYKSVEFGEFKVGKFKFKKSTLTAKGPIYDVIKEFILR
ncbi:MAG: RNA 2',3'-cyclic phosphodiesterase [Candidatus Odinarchaeia archaeon]